VQGCDITKVYSRRNKVVRGSSFKAQKGSNNGIMKNIHVRDVHINEMNGQGARK